MANTGYLYGTDRYLYLESGATWYPIAHITSLTDNSSFEMLKISDNTQGNVSASIPGSETVVDISFDANCRYDDVKSGATVLQLGAETLRIYHELRLKGHWKIAGRNDNATGVMEQTGDKYRDFWGYLNQFNQSFATKQIGTYSCAITTDGAVKTLTK